MNARRLIQLTVIVMFSSSFFSQLVGARDGDNVRPSVCAGTWYPGEADALAEHVDGLLDGATAPDVHGKPIAVIAPHAGYRFSAPTAAPAYAALKGHHYRRVIVLAFSHRNAARYEGVDVPAELTAYATPLGAIPIDRDACQRLLHDSTFESDPRIDAGEHSLELQLPLLRRAIGEFELVPLLVGQLSHEQCVAAAKAILLLVDDDTLLVASTDFTHYGPNYGYTPFTEDVPAHLEKLATDAASAIRRCDVDGFVEHLAATGDTICGRGPVTLLLRTLSMRGGADCVRAGFDTSGHMTGDYTNSVTYQSFVFTPPRGTLTDAERTALLKIARDTARAYLNGQPLPAVDASTLPDALRRDGGCFVTLTNHGRLRGCIGNMIASGPLYESVMRNAVSACQDPRFVDMPITAAELDELHIEISYLTPMHRVSDVHEIVVGRQGLLIGLGMQRGVLLPQVAYERGWRREEFLEQTCRKAGLPLNAWKRSEAEIDAFEAEVFGEAE